MPPIALAELHRRRREIEAGDERDGDEKTRKRCDQGRPSNGIRLVVAPECEEQYARDDGQPDCEAQQRHVQWLMPARNGHSCQVMRPMTPTIITSAYQYR